MTLRKYQNHTPLLGKGAFVDGSAVVIGDVEIGDDSSVWPLTVIRGDMHRIRIGARTSVQDGCVLHITHAGPFNPDGFPLLIGDDVTIAHKVMLHGCSVGSRVLIGMGSIVMDGAVVEDDVIIGAGSLVPPGKRLVSGFLYVGSPVKQVRPLTDKEKAFFTYSAANYVKLKDLHLAEGYDTLRPRPSYSGFNMHYQTVLFDLDGTLTDPREGITRSIQFALGKLGIDEPDLTKLEHFIGPPLLQAFMQFYDFDEAKAWEAVNFYRERFKVTGLYENRVFEGVTPLLETLGGQGRQLYIATSKPWVFAREIARHFDFAKHFKVIYGSELDGTRTNKVELIAHLMAEEGLDPASTLMIGDRKHDLIGARSNGLDAAAVGYGFGSREELSAEAPTYHFETLDEMHQAFLRR